MPLEKADISKLLATGWKPPTPIKMKAADGKTDIYGLMFRRRTSTRRRSIRSSTTCIPGRRAAAPAAAPSPPRAAIGRRSPSSASSSSRSTARGTPGRSKSFKDAYYGAMGRDNTIPDQIAGMKDLREAVSRASTSTGPASGATPAAASPRRRRCSGSPTSSRSASPSPATTTSATTRTTGASATRGCS